VILYLTEGPPAGDRPGAASSSTAGGRPRPRPFVTSHPTVGLLLDGGPGLVLAAPF